MQKTDVRRAGGGSSRRALKVAEWTWQPLRMRVLGPAELAASPALDVPPRLGTQADHRLEHLQRTRGM
jgi:hypothetical protein